MAVVVIGLGIGASTAVYGVVRSVLITPLPYPAPGELVMIFNQYPPLDIWRGAQSPGDLVDYRSR